MTVVPPGNAPRLTFGDICCGPCLFEIYLDGSPVWVDELTGGPERLASRVYRAHDRNDGNSAVVRVERMKLGAVVTESCAIATALGRGARKPTGNIWFAPLLSVDEKNKSTTAQYADVASRSNQLGRFALPGARWDGDDAIVELRFATPVRATWVRSILDSEIDEATRLADDGRVDNEQRKGFVVAHVPPDLCDELAARWAAFSARRGPVAAQLDANKFADLMANAGLEQQGERVANEVVQTILASWHLEGGALAGAGDAFDADRRGDHQAHLKALRDQLNFVREAAQRALDSIDSTVE